MRTAILLGFAMLCDAVRGSIEPWYPEDVRTFLGITLLVFIIMDIIDFFRGKTK